MEDYSRIMIYGANGYSAGIILEELLRRGVKPTLAGRNAEAVKKIADKYGCKYRVFRLDDAYQAAENLAGISTVLNCAGPFIETAPVLMKACLEAGADYLDITGEIPVYKEAWSNNEAARSKGIVILPGVGFDVIPTDCTAKKLAEELPGAVSLKLAFATRKGRISRGTLKTSLGQFGHSSYVRKGDLVPIETGELSRRINFGDFNSYSIAIQWGDVYNAYYSSGIDDIEVYMAVPGIVSRLLQYRWFYHKLLGSPLVKKALLYLTERFVTGPGEKERSRSLTYIWGRAEDESGSTAEHVYCFPDGYALTAEGASESVIRVFRKEVQPGTQTPSLAFGSSFMDKYLIKKIY